MHQVEKVVNGDKAKFEEALPVIGVVALVVAVGAWLYKKKPWKKGGAGAAA